MIDRNLLRENGEIIIKKIAQKDPDFDTRALIALDEQLSTLQKDIEQLRCEKNTLADAAKKGVTEEIREQSRQVSTILKEKEALLRRAQEQFTALYLACPNIPDQSLPLGNKEANKVVKSVGEKPTFAFEPQHHVTLGEKNGWLDFTAAATIAGSQFALYRGQAVQLMYSLISLMMKQNVAHGFEPIIPPYVVNAQSLTVSGNFPKFKDQVYAIEKDNLYLIPTAEVSLANLYRDQLLHSSKLPIRLSAWTSCFRREVGGYGAQERGLIRIHQFEKVELFTLCEPEHSDIEHERMLACAESILQQLGLHYRVSLLATQDCSFASAKTYDIEVWMPGQKAYYEVSSCSNCTDFQARRGHIRYRTAQSDKSELVHTLNSSSLALPRLMVALMETYQQSDGSLALPASLQQIW